MKRRISAVCITLVLALVSVTAVDASGTGDSPAGKPPKASGPPEYPAALRERVLEYRGVPRFDSDGGGTVTWLHGDAGAIMWDWKNRPDDSMTEEWRRLPTLAETMTLEPDVEYTFDAVWIRDCDDLAIDYPFKADRGLLLRVRKGDTVLFDALQEATRRSGRPLAEVVSIRQPPTPAVAATIAAPGENDVLGAVLQKLLDARAFCESPEAFRYKWLDEEKGHALGGLAKTTIDPLVLLEQPLWENTVVVLVYDPAARGVRSVEVSVLEGNCPEQYFEPGTPARLDPVEYDGPLFIGRANVEGAHGTVVKARYRRAGDAQRPAAVYESAPIGMAFH